MASNNGSPTAPVIEISSSPVTDEESEDLDGTNNVNMGDSSSEAGDPTVDVAALVRAELLLQLNSPKMGGKVSTGEKCPESVNPGLHIEGVGNVGLPLSDRDAKLIIEASHKAPFGKGSETIVDENVRKTWELNATQVRTRNPAWEKSLERILDLVASGLGILAGQRAIKARLHKLLLYEEGGCFRAHQDSEKEPRMFGTLVISLPSKHEGGAVVTTHAGKSSIYHTDKDEFESTYIAWYADVMHKVKPVISGYRFVITYNLIYTGMGGPQNAAIISNHESRMRKTMALWQQRMHDPTAPKSFAYILAHEYTEAGLGFHDLKGRDRHVAQTLLNAAHTEGFCVYLANVHREVEGGCDGMGDEEDDEDVGLTAEGFHKIEEVCSDETYLKQVVSWPNRIVADTLKIHETRFVQHRVFKRPPDDEEYSGYTGNEGVSAIHFYHHTAIIILPQSHKVDFLFQGVKDGDVDVKSWIRRLLKKYEAHPEKKDELGRLCELVMGQVEGHRAHIRKGYTYYRGDRSDYDNISDEALAMVTIASMRLKQLKMFQMALIFFQNKVPLSVFAEIGRNLHHLGFMEEVRHSLMMAVEGLRSLHERYEATFGFVSAVISAGQNTDMEEINRWARQRTASALIYAGADQKEDGESLVAIVEAYKSGLLDSVVKFAKNHIGNTAFAIAFVASLLKAGEEERIGKHHVTQIFREILPDLIPAISLQPIPSNKRIKTAYGMTPAPPIEVDGESTAYLLGQCEKLGLSTELEQLYSKLESEASSADGATLDTTVLPFLQKFLDTQQPPIQNPRIRSFAHNLILAYVKGYVQMEPARPINWRRTPKGCGCADCGELDAFIVDPLREIGEFSMAEKRRCHLASQLRDHAYAVYRERESEFVITTARIGSPHTLVVRKTDRAWQKVHTEWETRFNKAMERLKMLDAEKVKEVLSGTGTTFEDLMELRLVKVASTGNGTGAETGIGTGTVNGTGNGNGTGNHP
ncbi:MAG: Sorting nexin mvp1 [Watsoniomyces obsoletus]|nr:MAG: Sorting nexin mvp1 [Watsoniomyces obsoletus]